MSSPNIRPFQPNDETQIIDIWEMCNLTRAWNPPKRDIEEKLKVQPELFLILEKDTKIIGSIMAAYDGHRGVINYLAVHPDFQNQGFARLLMDAAETRLKSMGCPKINLVVRKNNFEVIEFYCHSGYEIQDVEVLGKWLNRD